MDNLDVQVNELEVDLSNIFDLLLVSNFNEDTNLIKQVSDTLRDFVTKLSGIKLEGLANYFGFLQVNWEEIEDFQSEHFDSVQNCIMHSLSMFDSDTDLEFLDQIEIALNTWKWPLDIPSDSIIEIMEGMRANMSQLLQLDLDNIAEQESKLVEEASIEELEAVALKELEQDSATVEELEAATLKELEQESATVEELEAAALKELELDSATVEELEAAALKELEQESATVEELEAAALKELEQESATVEELEAAALKELEQESATVEELEAAALKELEIESETEEKLLGRISLKTIYNEYSEAVMAKEFSYDIDSLHFSDNQNEIIVLLVDELVELSNQLESTVTEENISEKLKETNFYIENLIGAIEVIGYAELEEILKLIQLSVETINNAKGSVLLKEYKVAIIWPLIINNLFTNGINNETTHIISNYIQSLIPELDQKMADTVCMSLGSIDLTTLESDKRKERTIATIDDLNLIPEEGENNPSVLQSFFEELGDYTASYTQSINNFIKNKSFSELDVARRVVHTIKGSGNSTGIRGIANYTHNLEDILDELSKKNINPNESLSELLIESADYLEIMSESIVSNEEVPAEILINYQKILDWAYALDNGLTIEDIGTLEGFNTELKDDNKEIQITESLNISKSDNIISEPSKKLVKQTNTVQTTPVSSSSESIKVTKTQIEDLIRVVGENMISSGQVLEHAQKNKTRLDNAQKQFFTLNNLIANLEQLVFVRGINSDREKSKGEFDPLEMERYNELHTATQRIVESSLDGMEMLKESIEANVLLENVANEQIQLQKDNQDLVIQMRMLPVSFVASRFARAVRQTCRKTNKKVNFNLVGEETLVDSNVLQELVEPIMHILRNSIDHGIEDSEQRQANGKSKEGNITLKFERIADHISVICNDDGEGLNYDQIIETAKKKNLISENQSTFSPEEITRFILIPGFSTKDKLSHVSGRGIGMDVVNQKIHEIRGSLKINSVPQKGTEIAISIPVSLMSTHALLLDIGDSQFAISNRGVEDIIYLDDHSIKDIKQNNLIYWNNEALNVYSLADLLLLERFEKDIEKIAIIVTLSDGSHKAVISPFIKNSRDLVVKPLSNILPRIDGLIGASVLGDGSVAPVYDLTELNEKFIADDYIFNNSSVKIQKDYDDLLPCVLVVDDSISARRSMASFVKDLGFNVIQAGDGMEAQKSLKNNKVVLVITDLEMPRMNGFDLASHMQSRDSFKNIPIIMVSSRSTEKHKAIAKISGIDEYIVKPFDEDYLAEKLNKMLN